jgi:hypothetical protein
VDIPVRKRLGEILIERGKLDAATLERALRLQQESGERLGALLVTLGVVAQRDVARRLPSSLRCRWSTWRAIPSFRFSRSA